jgi:PAS domain S-box-containing protein
MTDPKDPIELEVQNEDLLQAQILLEKSRSKYADLYDFAPIGYLSVDKGGQILEANLTAAAILGKERRHLLGQILPLFLMESDRQSFRQLLHNCQKRQESRGEFSFRNNKGDFRTMLVNILVIEDTEGREVRRITLTDITELKQTQKALEESRQELRHLTERLFTIQELEQQRIARDLHDEMGQSLMALKMQFNAFKRSCQRGEATWDEFDRAVDSINDIAEQIRSVCRSLRPSTLENLGLNGALRQLLAEFQKHHQIQTSEQLEDVSGLFSSRAQITVYRIFQECLTNAVRHGKATSVKVAVQKTDGAVCFLCEDNGIGFDLAAVRSGDQDRWGIGLAAMEERVHLLRGSFEITSAKGEGTRINITLPPDKGEV